MYRRTMSLAVAVSLAAAAITAGPTVAAGPTRDGGSFTDRFFDDFILELCGIATFTTQTQRWSVKDFADGSAIVHVNRTFVSDDPRLPIEKGAATTFIAPDGTRTVIGKPIQLIGPHGGVRILDAGRVEFAPSGEVRRMSGPHPTLDADLADYYCP